MPIYFARKEVAERFIKERIGHIKKLKKRNSSYSNVKIPRYEIKKEKKMLGIDTEEKI